MINSEALLNKMVDVAKLPLVGKHYRHKKGDIYKVISIANTNASEDKKEEYPVTIVYLRVADSTIWSRPLSRWTYNFTRINLDD